MSPVSSSQNNEGQSKNNSQQPDERPRALSTPEPRDDNFNFMENGNGRPASDFGGGGDPMPTPSPTPIHREEVYYSNEDIELLHEIVRVGEDILAELPERDRLPTNALFTAADLVLPRNGFDMEDFPHIAKLLFRIGGQRGDEGLVDKFRGVLAGIGIELEFYEHSISQGSELGASPLGRQDRSSSPSPMRYAPHRRRNSDSIAVSFVAHGNGDPEGFGTPGPRTAHSLSGGTPDSRIKEVRFADVVDARSAFSETTRDPLEQNATVSPSERRLPLRPRPLPAGSLSNRYTSSRGGPNGAIRTPTRRRASESGSPPTLRPPTGVESHRSPSFGRLFFGPDPTNDGLPPLVNPRQQTAPQNGGIFSDETASESRGNDSLEDIAIPQPMPDVEEPSLPEQDVNNESEVYDGDDDSENLDQEDENDLRQFNEEYSSGERNPPPPRWGEYKLENLTVDQFTFVKAQEQSFLRASFGYWRVVADWENDFNTRAEDHAIEWDRLEAVGDALQVWVQSTLMMHADENEGRRLYEESTRQRSVEGEPQGRPGPSQERHMFERGSARAPGFEPSEYDTEDDRQMVPFQGQSESELDRNEQYNLAAAAWDNFLVSKAFTHWVNRASEEYQRTRTARRHIMRRRFFGAWVEQKDEAEAQAKIKAFGQEVVVRQWHDATQNACIVQEGNEQLADQLYQREVAEETFRTWLGEHKLNQAATMDERRLRNMCGEIWQADSLWLAQAQDEADNHFRDSVLGTAFATWRTEARVQVRADDGARPIIARRDEFLKSGLSLAWRHDAEETDARAKLAVDYEKKYVLKDWGYETKLGQFEAQEKAEIIDSVTYHWYCEWRLVLCKRILAQQDTQSFIDRWRDVTADTRATADQMEATADDFHHHNTVVNSLEQARDVLEDLEDAAGQARAISLHRTVPRVVNKWTRYLGWANRMTRWGNLGRFFGVGEQVLEHWPAIRKQEWQRRMYQLYTDFRYRVRCDKLRDCLDTWRRGTAETITSNWEADDMRQQDDQALVFDVLAGWTERLEFVDFSTEVAEDADKEAPLIIWNSLLENLHESDEDAVDFDTAQTLGVYWESLELTAVQLRGKHHTMQEVTDLNDRKLRKQMFVQWAGQVNPDRAPELDFRTSRRTTRWTTPAPARSRMVVDYTPFRTPFRPERTERTPYRPPYRPPSELTFEENEEFGLEED